MVIVIKFLFFLALYAASALIYLAPKWPASLREWAILFGVGIPTALLLEAISELLSAKFKTTQLNEHHFSAKNVILAFLTVSTIFGAVFIFYRLMGKI
ncbi:MAG: hypothetical protein KCHDKBKB_01918 [Elusimicrobia bacterium]|nr:hypothetical protein [Elusimicrobiota bacterium]